MNSAFRDFVADKRVALVGGYKEFDRGVCNFDLIARINLNWQLDDRVDILYSEPVDEQFTKIVLSAENLKHTWHWINAATIQGQRVFEALPELVTGRAGKFLNATFRHTNPVGPEHEWLNCFRKEWEFHPCTGVVAAKHLLLYPIKELYLTGFTFYYDFKNKTFREKKGPHQIQRNIAALTNLFKIDARAVPDQTLKTLLDLTTTYI